MKPITHLDATQEPEALQRDSFQDQVAVACCGLIVALVLTFIAALWLGIL